MDTQTTDRLRALDGLRGIAALVVLLSHVVLASVGVLTMADAIGGDPPGAWWLLLRTPLAVVWAGPELVIVFFVLSGLVLTRAALAAPGGVRPLAFYAGRTVRLFLPAWASLLPAAALVVLVPRHVGGGPGTGFWLQAFTEPVDVRQVCSDLALVVGTHGVTLSGVLWSLRWEVVFSLLLPLVVAAAPVLRRLAAPLVVLLPAVVLGAGAHESLRYLPPFGVGVLLALRPDAVAALRERLAGRGVPAAVAVTAGLLTADLWLPDARTAPGSGGALVVIGAGAAVLLPLVYGGVARGLEARPVQWLGRRSFSLYLVHEPIVVTLAFALGRPGFGVLLAVALPGSLAAAEVFHRLVERPAHRLARSATADLQRRSAARRPAGRAEAGPAGA
ncbi:acyltransferase [Baekduia soli]|uniref:Acyltransferase n=1 Tax=Baekduia soli TaxID=496014 RepID=A0A5B8U772_9ACTN|nr:acyltransferase [Baekduia soli]QEC48522.1 acyltransferase [Baekduia soli]